MLGQKGENAEVQTQKEIVPSLKAPFEQNTKVGELVYYINGTEAGRCDLVTASDMKKASVEKMLHRLFQKWCL